MLPVIIYYHGQLPIRAAFIVPYIQVLLIDCLRDNIFMHPHSLLLHVSLIYMIVYVLIIMLRQLRLHFDQTTTLMVLL